MRVACLGNLGGQPHANIFHCFLADNAVTSDAQLQTWLNAFHSALLSTDFYGWASSSLSVTTFEAVLFVNPVLVFRALNTQLIVGQAAPPTLTAAMSVCISWNSSAYWRGGKPRTYVGGVPANIADTNHSLLDTSKAAIQTRAINFRAAVNAITTPNIPSTQLGFIHWQKGNVWLTPPLFFPATGAVVHDRLATQRRRLGPWLP